MYKILSFMTDCVNHGENTCSTVNNSIIREGLCNGSSGRSGHSCAYSENVTIGNNSCNNQLDGNKRHNVCYRCKNNVPDNAYNQGITAS